MLPFFCLPSAARSRRERRLRQFWESGVRGELQAKATERSTLPGGR